MKENLTFALCLFALCYLTARCSPREAAQDVAAASYEAQQMRCVEQYAHKADIDRCRMRVKAAWSSSDAGADQ